MFEPMYYIFSTLIIISQLLVSLSFYAALYKSYLHSYIPSVFHDFEDYNAGQYRIFVAVA